MLRPIPRRILRSTALRKVCTGTDAYKNQEYGQQYTVQHVHLQPTDRIVKTKDNTDHQLASVLFVDARHSSPVLSWQALLESAHKRGGDMRVTVRNTDYTVVTVDTLYDDTDRLHHWEIGME